MIKFIFLFLALLRMAVAIPYGESAEKINEDFVDFQNAVMHHTPPGVENACMALCYVWHLTGEMERADKTDTKKLLAKNIAAILYEGRGVGGLMQREATEDEARLMLGLLGNVRFVDALPAPSMNDKKHQQTVRYYWDSLTKQTPTTAFLNTQAVFMDNSVRNVNSTEQYGVLNLPTAPLFHAYDPVAEEKEKPLAFPIALRLPFLTLNNPSVQIPDEIKAQLRGVSLSDLDLFFVVQNNPNNRGLIMRPHYWMDPSAPTISNAYEKNFHFSWVAAKASSGPTIDATFPLRYSTAYLHPGTHKFYGQDVNLVVSSPDAPELNGAGIPNHTTLALWSIIHCAEQRTALTLHWILNQPDFEKMSSAMHGKKNGQKLNFSDVGTIITQAQRSGSFAFETLQRLNF